MVIKNRLAAYTLIIGIAAGLQACGGSELVDINTLDSATETNNSTTSPENSANPENSIEDPTIKLFQPVSYLKIAEGLSGFSGGVSGGERFGRDTSPAGDILSLIHI